MKFRVIASMMVMAVMSALSAVPDIPEGYVPQRGEEEKIVYADDFTGPLVGWKETNPGLFKLTANAGPNGRTGLVADRENPEVHAMLDREFIGIPGKRYLARMLLKADNLRTPTSHTQGKDATIIIHPLFLDHFNADGSYNSGSYSCLNVACGRNTGWYEISYEFDYPKDAARSLLHIGGYTPGHSEKIQGTLYYSGLEIRQIGNIPLLIYPLRPTQLLLDDSGEITVRVHDFMGLKGSQYGVRAVCGEREVTAPIRDENAVVAFGKLPQGRHEVKFQVLDTEKKEVLGAQSYFFMVPAPGEGDFPGSARVDDHGVLYVDGKPFMTRYTCVSPFMLDELAVQRIHDVGYNAILAYDSPSMTLHAGDAKPRTIECLKRALDYLHEHDMKIVFCVKEQVQNGIMEFDGVKGRFELVEHIVRHFKRHPAILCWYISDENPLHEIPKIIELRHRISAIDPFHPVLTCTCVPRDQYHFAQTGDIMNPDCYPIFNDRSQSMFDIREHLNRKTGLPIWFAAQGFNWGAYHTQNYGLYRYPTEEEMRSMGLLAMNLGVRGISYYSYSAVFTRQEKMEHGSSRWFWPRVVNVVRLFKELEGFFFTQETAPTVEITAKTGMPQTEVRAFRDGKRVCVVVTGDGPGDVSVTFKVPEVQNLRSRFGRIAANQDGSFTFIGKDICSDILVNW